jgi:hypothetical protein
LRAIGTLDEIAQQLSEAALVRVVIDHENREVRIFRISQELVEE